MTGLTTVLFVAVVGCQFDCEDAAHLQKALLGAISARFDQSRLWEPLRVPSNQSPQPGGRTALAVMTLLGAGVPAQRDDLAHALPRLEAASLEGTYAIAARLMALSHLPADRRSPMGRDVTRLLRAFDQAACGWDYGPVPRRAFVDQSLTQFSLLALSGAKHRGFPVPERLFERVRDRFLALQGEDGGWGYRRNDPSRGSLTAAGLATLALCDAAASPSGSIEARCHDARRTARQWLATKFTAARNPGCSRWTDYWLVMAERAARATGAIRFGEERWLEAGMESIARRLLVRDGKGWRERRGSPVGIEKLCFAAQFIQAAQVPLVVGVLDPTESGSMDDLGAALAIVIGDRLERRVGWARLSLALPIEDWLLCPLLVVDCALEGFTAPEPSLTTRLQEYLHRGGTVVCVNDARRARAVAEGISSLDTWRAEKTPQSSGRVSRVRTLGTAARVWIHDLGFLKPLDRSPRKRAQAIDALASVWFAATGGAPIPRLRPRPSTMLAGLELVVCLSDTSEPDLLGQLAEELGRVGLRVRGTNQANAKVHWVRGATEADAVAIELDSLVDDVAVNRVLIIDSIGNGPFAAILANRLASALGGTLLPHPFGLVLRSEGREVAFISPRDAAISLIREEACVRQVEGLPFKTLQTVLRPFAVEQPSRSE